MTPVPEAPLPEIEQVPRTPPTPAEVGAAPVVDGPNPTTPPSTVPLGSGTASVGPDTPVVKKRRFRLRTLLLNLIVLTTLGYGLGTYYALVNDNWHDFFTEYVPFGEDAVAYFEEREFKRRFSESNVSQTKLHDQVRGERKVNIPSHSGVSARAASESDLSLKGRHLSAVEDRKPGQTPTAGSQGAPAAAPPAATEKGSAAAKSAELPADKQTQSTQPSVAPPSAPGPSTPAPAQSASVPAPAPAPAAPATKIESIDPFTIESASEPVVQDVVKILNDIITVINVDNAGSKYMTTVEQAKGSLSKVISDLQALKETERKATEDRIAAIHTEFDTAAQELVRRQQEDARNQEMRWREEYETERQRLSDAFEKKLQEELGSAKKLYEQKTKNELLEQSINLQRQLAETIQDRVENERGGRLSKIEQLTSNVQELEKLTAEWNSVLESNLKTQHLIVAVEAVRAVLERSEVPTPFINQLAALKEVAAGDAVVDAAIATINPTAYQKGIPTPSMLIDRFRRVANEVRKAALLPADAGVASHAASLVLSKVMFKKQGIPEGEDVESVLGRAEILLEEGRLEEAAREVNGLSGWAKVLAGDWLKSVRQVIEVQNALDVSQNSRTNLIVEM